MQCSSQSWIIHAKNISAILTHMSEHFYQMFGREENNKMVQSCYGGSWRKMWISRPRLRFDGWGMLFRKSSIFCSNALVPIFF